MRGVDEDAELIHPPDHRDAEVAQTGVSAFGRTVTEQVALVVGELHRTDTEPVEHVEIFQPALDRAVLEVEHYRILAFLLGPLDVGGGARVQQLAAVGGDELVPRHTVGDGTVHRPAVEHIGAFGILRDAGAQRRAHAGHAAVGDEFEAFFVAQFVGEHVDDDGARVDILGVLHQRRHIRRFAERGQRPRKCQGRPAGQKLSPIDRHCFRPPLTKLLRISYPVTCGPASALPGAPAGRRGRPAVRGGR